MKRLALVAMLIAFAAAPALASGSKPAKPAEPPPPPPPPPKVEKQIEEGKIINPNFNSDLEGASEGTAK